MIANTLAKIFQRQRDIVKFKMHSYCILEAKKEKEPPGGARNPAPSVTLTTTRHLD